MGATVVTPSGVRDGDTAALAALCDRRGPAVLAYCRAVAGDAAAAPAAAEAFAHFRAAVYAAEDVTSLNPESLLINVTRHAAARHTAIAAGGLCAEVPALLAARADRSITLANHEFLDGHLGACWTCRAPVARFEAAERAYVDPGNTVVTPEDFVRIMAAMTAAAPVRQDEPAPEPPPVEVAPLTAAAQNGAGHLDAPEPAPAEPVAPVTPVEAVEAIAPLDQPTTEYRAFDEADFEPPPAAESLPAAEEAPAAGRMSRRPRPRSAGALAAGVRQPRPQRGAPKAARASRPKPAAGAVSLPRPQRASGPPRAARSPVRAGLVLPVILVAFALVIALFVAGVFGADDPASTPSSSTPPPPPAATTTPEVVVVPGAGEASDVELAKQRARAKRSREAAADRDASTPATPPAPPAAANTAPPPPAAAAGAPAANDEPAPADKTSIDADNGATGAEQLPPAQDTSTVPELAPPPEAAVPPG